MVLSRKVTRYFSSPETRSHVTQAGFKLPTLENDPEFLLFCVHLLSVGIKHSKRYQLSYEHPQSSGSFLIHPGLFKEKRVKRDSSPRKTGTPQEPSLAQVTLTQAWRQHPLPLNTGLTHSSLCLSWHSQNGEPKPLLSRHPESGPLSKQSRQERRGPISRQSSWNFKTHLKMVKGGDPSSAFYSLGMTPVNTRFHLWPCSASRAAAWTSINYFRSPAK